MPVVSRCRCVSKSAQPRDLSDKKREKTTNASSNTIATPWLQCILFLLDMILYLFYHDTRTKDFSLLFDSCRDNLIPYSLPLALSIRLLVFLSLYLSLFQSHTRRALCLSISNKNLIVFDSLIVCSPGGPPNDLCPRPAYTLSSNVTPKGSPSSFVRFLTTIAHTLDSVLFVKGLCLLRYHHIFRILRSISLKKK